VFAKNKEGALGARLQVVLGMNKVRNRRSIAHNRAGYKHYANGFLMMNSTLYDSYSVIGFHIPYLR
jgi:hypothetical protein